MWASVRTHVATTIRYCSANMRLTRIYKLGSHIVRHLHDARERRIYMLPCLPPTRRWACILRTYLTQHPYLLLT